MPHVVQELSVDEISVVDSPACAEEDEYGRKIPRARIALLKRDSDADNRKGKKMGFKTILKSARTREEIIRAIEGKATKIAKRDKISDDLALAKAWEQHPEAVAAYENAPKPTAKRPERKTYQATAAEAELDKRARKRMRKTGQSYPRAVSAELEADPNLYQRYERELHSGNTYEVPVPEYMAIPGGNSDDMLFNKLGKLSYPPDGGDSVDDDDDTDQPELKSDDECDDCGADIDEDDKFCSSCGSDLEKARKAKRQAGKKKGGPGGLSLPRRG